MQFEAIHVMKKFIVTILSVLYIATSSGASINFHYCMDKFISWSFSLPVNKECSNCGKKKEKQKSCCHDKTETLQVKKDHHATQIGPVPENSIQYLNKCYFTLASGITSVNINDFRIAHSCLPGVNTTPGFLINCVFRI